MREDQRVGPDYLADMTTLLQRVRTAHPTDGTYDAAELQWWWGQKQRSTDDLGQLFWFDQLGRPEAAVIATEWSYGIQLDALLMPTATPGWVAHVMERGLAHAAESGFEVVQLEVDRANEVMREVLFGHGFEIKEEGVVESWLNADARPEISQLRDGYRLTTRAETMDQPHHMIKLSGPNVGARLAQTSLYRTDLDLLVLDHEDNAAARGLFWYDPETSTGVVEPMRTEEDHQQRGLARHILTAGVDLLAKAGAERIKICFESDNPASGHLYVSAGFEPVTKTDVFGGPTTGRAS